MTALILGGAIVGTRLLAETPVPQTYRQQPADTAQCADAARSQVKRRALLGFARSLAGNLPMVGHSVGAAVAGQATAAAIDGAASADVAQTSRCAG